MPLPEQFTDLARRVNNWGRWGPEDERGTLNLITPERVVHAASLVRTGRRFTLALPLDEDGPQIGMIEGRDNPKRTMIMVNAQVMGPEHAFRTSDDRVEMGLQAGTHWDALAHVSYQGRLYNGFDASEITEAGAAHCGIDKAGPIVGRGVLLDVARALGVPRLGDATRGHALTAADLDAAAEFGKAEIRPGDIVLIRTGAMTTLKAGDKPGYNYPCSGPSMQTVPWFHAHDVAAVATDTMAFEVYPPERDDAQLPVHLLHLVEMGMLQGQNWDLEALAEDCAADGVYEFFLTASPEPFTRAVGAPVIPVAVK
ncbi:cyclase family protein [Catenulispora sp. NF23]|uniref:cyclase family protein n=1 Tax=Catenulispora pinistramenti TaxID=2705254 RepID=UPI001BAA6930|nr:cyclase family protein [Catenulispora pinistramenti]MBS2535674.1 cyclase family protein [Catenulispora pinistramenti]